MQYTKPDYYEQFTCLAGECPRTCCAGWQIVIDPESLMCYRKYQAEGHPFGNRLYNGIDWEEEIFYQSPDKRCEFLDENNLCDIYSEAGKEMLCDTCRTYPRHIEEFEGIRENSLCLSCPEAARIILEKKDKVTFICEEDDKSEEYEDFDYFLFSCLSEAREYLIELIQDRSVPVYRRIEKAMVYVAELQVCIDKEEYFRCDGLRKTGLAGSYPSFIDDIYQPDYMKRLWEPFVTEMEILQEAWPKQLASTMEILYQGSAESYKTKITSFEQNYPDWEIECEQLMIYWIYTYFCGAVYDQNVVGKFNLAVVSTMLIRELAAAQYCRNGSYNKTDQIQVCMEYSREVEHSEENLEILNSGWNIP